MAKWSEDSAWKAGLTAALLGMVHGRREEPWITPIRSTTQQALKQSVQRGWAAGESYAWVDKARPMPIRSGYFREGGAYRPAEALVFRRPELSGPSVEGRRIVYRSDLGTPSTARYLKKGSPGDAWDDQSASRILVDPIIDGGRYGGPSDVTLYGVTRKNAPKVHADGTGRFNLGPRDPAVQLYSKEGDDTIYADLGPVRDLVEQGKSTSVLQDAWYRPGDILENYRQMTREREGIIDYLRLNGSIMSPRAARRFAERTALADYLGEVKAIAASNAEAAENIFYLGRPSYERLRSWNLAGALTEGEIPASYIQDIRSGRIPYLEGKPYIVEPLRDPIHAIGLEVPSASQDRQTFDTLRYLLDRKKIPFAEYADDAERLKVQQQLQLDAKGGDTRADAKGGESADDLGDLISELPPDDDLGDFIFENRL